MVFTWTGMVMPHSVDLQSGCSTAFWFLYSNKLHSKLDEYQQSRSIDQSSNYTERKKCRRAVILKASSTISTDEQSDDGLNGQKLTFNFFATTRLHYNISQNPNWHVGTNDVHNYAENTQLKLLLLPGMGIAASLNCMWCCDLQKARVSISKTMAGTALVSPPDKENVPLVSHS